MFSDCICNSRSRPRSTHPRLTQRLHRIAELLLAGFEALGHSGSLQTETLETLLGFLEPAIHRPEPLSLREP